MAYRHEIHPSVSVARVGNNEEGFYYMAQFVNYTDPAADKDNSIPKPPTYYAYWWPPQSPMFVLSGPSMQKSGARKPIRQASRGPGRHNAHE